MEHNSSMFSRFRSKHNKASLLNEENLGCHTVDLRTSTIKIDAEDSDLRLCFRIISPAKTYTLQAENGADRMDWINKITGVIASLLNSHILQQPHPGTKLLDNNDSAISAYDVRSLNGLPEDDLKVNQADNVSKVLREIPGNDLCAECSAPEPDWASLNLGILLCIECSGVHRNLGVHISKLQLPVVALEPVDNTLEPREVVRSITLDVKVWEPPILDLFRTLGNTYCNSIWEELLLLQKERETLWANQQHNPCSARDLILIISQAVSHSLP
uniref:Uncharacterized protein n=1 Tax=Vitis vinifera TaxID=29760 RepID=A5C0F3_VITVI|nr:hypothetical protein VITISV_039033 [Vitis vinifera]